jgi:HK97 family phage major capsid protein
LVYRKAEAAAATESQPKFRKMTLDLEDMIGLCYATNKLIKNVASLEAVIREGFAEEFAFKLDDEIINGTGAGQCLGVLNSNALVTVPKETGQAADTILAENILKMWSRMWARCRKNALWLINQDCEPQLHALTLNVGTGGVPVYMPAGGLSQSPYATLYGRPVIPIEQCQTVGDKGDILLIDPSEYVLIDQEMEEASSIHVRFLYGENTFRFAYPVNGQPKWNAPKTPKNGSNTLSAFVALAARA